MDLGICAGMVVKLRCALGVQLSSAVMKNVLGRPLEEPDILQADRYAYAVSCQIRAATDEELQEMDLQFQEPRDGGSCFHLQDGVYLLLLLETIPSVAELLEDPEHQVRVVTQRLIKTCRILAYDQKASFMSRSMHYASYKLKKQANMPCMSELSCHIPEIVACGGPSACGGAHMVSPSVVGPVVGPHMVSPSACGKAGLKL